jgi:sortase A
MLVQPRTVPADGVSVRLRIKFMRFMTMASVMSAVLVVAPAMAATPQDGLIPNPARQSTFHRSQYSGAQMGAIRIPAIELDEVIRSGVSLSVIDQGVAHWAGTARAGENGNVVLAGHRTTHSQPFRNLDRLDDGDLIYVQDGDGFEVMYRVSESYIVEPNDMWISYETEQPTLTMFACHPKGSARYRIVVSAEMVAGRHIA